MCKKELEMHINQANGKKRVIIRISYDFHAFQAGNKAE